MVNTYDISTKMRLHNRIKVEYDPFGVMHHITMATFLLQVVLLEE
jgi:hypothetical protein